MKKSLLLLIAILLTFTVSPISNASASDDTGEVIEMTPEHNFLNLQEEELLKTMKEEGLIEKDIDAKDIISIEEVEDPNELLIQPFISGNEASYKYWIKSGNQKYTNTTYGKWTNKGSLYHGPGTLNKTYTTKTSISVSVAAEVSIKAVKATFTPSFSKETTLTTQVSRNIPKGKKGQFQVRDVYKHYKVTMAEWISIDGRKSKTGRTKTATIKKKTNFESRIILK